MGIQLERLVQVTNLLLMKQYVYCVHSLKSLLFIYCIVYKLLDWTVSRMTEEMCKLYIVCLLQVISHGKVEVKFLYYRNPSWEDYGGDCCDPSFFVCVNECDNFFEFCYRNYSSTGPCLVHKITDNFDENDDDFAFPIGTGVLGNGVSNPVSFAFSGKWPVGLYQ